MYKKIVSKEGKRNYRTFILIISVDKYAVTIFFSLSEQQF